MFISFLYLLLLSQDTNQTQILHWGRRKKTASPNTQQNRRWTCIPELLCCNNFLTTGNQQITHYFYPREMIQPPSSSQHAWSYLTQVTCCNSIGIVWREESKGFLAVPNTPPLTLFTLRNLFYFLHSNGQGISIVCIDHVNKMHGTVASMYQHKTKHIEGKYSSVRK